MTPGAYAFLRQVSHDVYCVVQVPYGTSFHQNVQWACRYEGRGKCRLRVTGEVEFTKSPFVKGMIQKASEEVELLMLLRFGLSLLLCIQAILLSSPKTLDFVWGKSMLPNTYSLNMPGRC